MQKSRIYTAMLLAVVMAAAFSVVVLKSDKTVVGAESTTAEDTAENRKTLAERCVQNAPTDVVARMACGRVASLRSDIPESRRQEFIDAMFAELDLAKMTEKRVEMMAKHFTADELAALAAFYQSPSGSTAWQKLGTFVVDMQSEMRPHILAAEARARAALSLPAQK